MGASEPADLYSLHDVPAKRPGELHLKAANFLHRILYGCIATRLSCLHMAVAAMNTSCQELFSKVLSGNAIVNGGGAIEG